MTRLDSPASCVDYAPDGELLVVGFGSRTRNISSGGASTSSDTSGKLTTEGEASGSDNKDGGGSGALRRARGKRGKKPGSEDGGGGASSGSSGRNGDAKTGGFIILNEADFVTVFEARDTKKVLPCIHDKLLSCLGVRCRRKGFGFSSAGASWCLRDSGPFVAQDYF